jgi:hypothetical protein
LNYFKIIFNNLRNPLSEEPIDAVKNPYLLNLKSRLGFGIAEGKSLSVLGIATYARDLLFPPSIVLGESVVGMTTNYTITFKTSVEIPPLSKNGSVVL